MRTLKQGVGGGKHSSEIETVQAMRPGQPTQGERKRIYSIASATICYSGIRGNGSRREDEGKEGRERGTAAGEWDSDVKF